ncbi:MAG: ABC transporter permease [Alphaproteobacteria bacterium]|nr:ABC transporter permease [Alphaproteobacteria bacterium]
MPPALIRSLPWSLPLALVVVWEIVCRAFGILPYILPPPSAVAETMFAFYGPIAQHSLQTLFTTVVGFGIAVAFGLALGIALGASKPVYDALYPMMVGFNSVPKVAIVPILVIWFGIGTVPAILTAFLISFFPIVVNVATGLATIEPELQDVLRSLGARKLQILIKVGIPRSMPYFFASLKVAITLAFVGSVMSEMVASNSGIGYLMQRAASEFNGPLLFAGLIVIAIMGVLMYEAFVWIERRFTFWATRAQDGMT